MAQPATPRTPLGVGSLVTATFGLFFRRILVFMTIGSLPIAVMLGLQILVGQSWLEIFAGGLQNTDALTALWRDLSFLVAIFVIATLISNFLIVLCAYDACHGIPINLLSHLWRSLVSTPVVVVLSVVLLAVFAALFGFLFALQAQLPPFLIALVGFVASLYILARFAVLLPVILVSRAGFRALGQTAHLTSDYRWSIVGLYLLFTLTIFLISLIPGIIIFFAQVALLAEGAPGTLVMMALSIVQWALSVAQTTLFAVLNTLLYARLRTIKEGVSTADLSEVFA